MAYFEFGCPRDQQDGNLYRNPYVKWIESAKRPETRAARIQGMIEPPKDGKKQK